MLMFKKDDNYSGKGFLFCAYEGEKCVGKAYFTVDSLYCDIYKVEYEKDKLYVFQGLLKSCYNFGATKNAYMGRLSDNACYEEAKTMNFVFDGSTFSSDIPTLLMGGCCQEECSQSFYTTD